MSDIPKNKCIRNDIKYSENCGPTDGKCHYSYSKSGSVYSGEFRCKKDDSFIPSGLDIVLTCPSRTDIPFPLNMSGSCDYFPDDPKPIQPQKFYSSVTLNVSIIAAVIIFIIVITLIIINITKKKNN